MTNGYLLPLLEIVTRDILRVMNVIGVVNDKIMANVSFSFFFSKRCYFFDIFSFLYHSFSYLFYKGFVCEASFLEGVDFSVSVAEKVIRLVVDSLTNYVFTVTNEVFFCFHFIFFFFAISMLKEQFNTRP